MLDSLHFDTETFTLTAEDQAPPLVLLQYCLAPAPIVVGATGTGTKRTGGRLVDSAELPWRGMSSFDIIGPAPAQEAVDDDDPADEARVARSWHEDVMPCLVDSDEALEVFEWMLDSSYLLCGVNSSYDLLVLLRHAKRRGKNLWRLAFDMLADARFRDTQVSQKLLNIADGVEMYRTGMDGLAKHYLHLDLGSDKRGPHSWRLKYRWLLHWPANKEEFIAAHRKGIVSDQQLRDVQQKHLFADSPIVYGALRPVSTWPYHARRYAMDDVLFDREIWRLQREEAMRLFGVPEIPDEVARPVARFCLHLQSTRGIMTDYHRACEARVSLRTERDHLMAILIEAGLINRKVTWTPAAGVKPGTRVRVLGELPGGEAYTFVERCTKKGVPNENARSARIEGEETDVPRIVPLADLDVIEKIVPGVKLTRNMAEIRTRIITTLLANGYTEKDLDDPSMRTPSGKEVATNKDIMEIVASKSKDKGLLVLSAKGKVDKLLGTYVEALCHDRAVHFSYDVLKDTGRTSTMAQKFMSESTEGVMIAIKEGTNVQNFPQNQALERTALEILKHSKHSPANPDRWVMEWVDKHSPRRMIVARPGFVFSIHDFSSIELGTFARTLNKFMGEQCTMARKINEGADLHLYTGVALHPLLWPQFNEHFTYEELQYWKGVGEECKKLKKVPPPEAKRVARTRQTGKPTNFGFLGGMGAAKFIFYALQSYGVDIEPEVAKAARKGWLRTYPEVQPHYFDRIAEHFRLGLPVTQIGTKRVRRGCTYSAMCNSYFQGLAADGAMQANWRLTYASYIDEESPLFGSYPLIFEHDAFVVEVPERNAEAAHAEVGRLMVEGMEVYLKDIKRPHLSVAVKTEGVLDTRWSK
jgi:hypothetical protein